MKKTISQYLIRLAHANQTNSVTRFGDSVAIEVGDITCGVEEALATYEYLTDDSKKILEGMTVREAVIAIYSAPKIFEYLPINYSLQLELVDQKNINKGSDQ